FCLIAAIPLLNVLNAQPAWTALYLINAVLLLALYLAAEEGFAPRLLPGSAYVVAGALAFCVFLPVFVQLTGHIFNPSQPVFDSGGVLRTLPIPISVAACFVVLVALGRFGDAAASFWSILGLMVAMLLSTVVVA